MVNNSEIRLIAKIENRLRQNQRAKSIFENMTRFEGLVPIQLINSSSSSEGSKMLEPNYQLIWDSIAWFENLC